MVVTIPDSIAQGAQGQMTDISVESERRFVPGYSLSSKKPCGFWPLLKDRSGRGVMHFLALGKWLLLGPVLCPRECGLKERYCTRKENLILSQTPTVKALQALKRNQQHWVGD